MNTRMLVVTNRRLNNPSANNEKLFGENPHINGPAEVRLAWAEKQGKKWKLSLIKEPDPIEVESLPSKNIFLEFKKTLKSNDQNCAFYVHGYNKDFDETLSQGWEMQRRYGVGVVLFSWASNPGGIPPFDYPKARAIAGASSPALDMTLEKLGRYMCDEVDSDCEISLNLIVHSLGAYLFQRFVEKPLFAGETRIFDNLILHQADVDSIGHESWVDKLRFARRIYITVNERDKILDISDIANPDRLGNTASNFNSQRAKYFDFTEAKKIRKAHQLFGKPAEKNIVVKRFFSQILNGESAEELNGIHFNSGKNAFEVS